jgi:MFS family permease
MTQDTAGALKASEADRGLRAILGAVAVSSLGDGAFSSAAPLAAAAITREPLAVALVSTAAYLPWLLIAPFAGALVDRWPRRRVLVVADLARAAALVALAVLVAFDAATIPLLSLVAFVVVVGQVFHDTAYQIVVSTLTAAVPAATRDRINGRIYGADTAGRSLLGPPAGSASFAALPWIPFAFDAASFAASGLLMSSLPPDERSTGPAESVRSAIRSGVRWLARNVELRTLAILVAIANLTHNAAYATLVLYATSRSGLDVSTFGFGLLVGAMALGGVIGGPLTRVVKGRVGAAGTALGALVLYAIAWTVIAITSSAWVAGVALAAIGLGTTLVTTAVVSRRQELSPPDMLGRVVTTMRTLSNGVSPLGAVLGGLIASGAGLRAPFFVASIVLVLGAALGGLALRGHLRTR